MATSRQPLLSIVVPVYNGMPYLKETLDSTLGQLTSDIQIVVRNNGSTDGTAAYLDSIQDPRVRVVHSDHTVSAGRNWSEVCRQATGTYTKVLCADDVVLPGGLDRQLTAARAHPDAVAIASRRQIIDEQGRVILRAHGLAGFVGRFDGADVAKRAILKGTNPFGETSSALFRTDVLLKELPFTEDHPYLTDFDMFVRVLQHGAFVGLDTVDGAFRVSSTSWSASIGASQLTQFRAWVNSLVERGILALSPAELRMMRARARVMFIARQAVSVLAPFLGAFRR